MRRIVTLILCVVALCATFAGCAALQGTGTTQDAAAQQADPGQSILSMVLIIAVPVAVFYFFLIRPQRKQDKKKKEMLKNVVVGDQVTTIGGIVGKVVSIKDDIITVESGADKNRMRFRRWGIQSVDVKVQVDDEEEA